MTKEHHNWSRIFGDGDISLSDVTPYVEKAVNNGSWQTTGVIRGKGGVVIGEKLEIIQQVDGYTIWVGGFKDATGKIIVNNAAVQ